MDLQLDLEQFSEIEEGKHNQPKGCVYASDTEPQQEETESQKGELIINLSKDNCFPKRFDTVSDRSDEGSGNGNQPHLDTNRNATDVAQLISNTIS